jgi:hypothetical protein
MNKPTSPEQIAELPKEKDFSSFFGFVRPMNGFAVGTPDLCKPSSHPD